MINCNIALFVFKWGLLQTDFSENFKMTIYILCIYVILKSQPADNFHIILIYTAVSKSKKSDVPNLFKYT